MKNRITHYLFFTLILILTTNIFSCKSSFPMAGSTIECNGKQINPILNPTKRAEFPGDTQAMYRFLKTNYKIPKELVNKDIKGKIRIAFIVTKEGDICDVRITSKPRKYIDDEFIRLFEIMPKWIPATNKGVIVDSYHLIDIKF